MKKNDDINSYSRKKVVDFYDEERFTSVAGRMFDTVEKEIVLSNAPLIDGKKLVLEVGAGTGRFSIELAKRGFNVISCDISEPMLYRVKEKIRNSEIEDKIALTKCSIYNIPYKSNTFNYTFCIRVLNNLATKENEIKEIKELVRVSKNIILFDVVNLYSIARINPLDKSAFISVNEMKKALNGLKNVKILNIEGRRLIPHTVFIYTSNFFLPFLEKLDTLLCKRLSDFAVREYFSLQKLPLTEEERIINVKKTQL